MRKPLLGNMHNAQHIKTHMPNAQDIKTNMAN